MPAAVYDFTIEQGATFEQEFFYTTDNDVVIPLTNYTARMQIRSAVTANTVLYEATTENGRLSIDGAAGKISLLFSATDTSSMIFSTGVYDLEIISPLGKVVRLMKGKVFIDPEVTR